MVAQAGKDMLIKVDVTGDGAFQTIGGLRMSKMALNAKSVDVTNISSQGQWRELLSKSGVRAASISGSGVFTDDVSDGRIRQAFFDGEHPKMMFIIPDFGAMIGSFQVNALEYQGRFDGEANFDMSFASAGEISFTPAQGETESE